MKQIIGNIARRLLGRGVRSRFQRQVAPLGKNSVDRERAFQHYFEFIKNVPGDLVDCGIGGGKSLYLINQFSELNKRESQIWSFTGFQQLHHNLKYYEGGPVAFLYLDLATYEAYRDALQFFWDKMAPGAIIAFEEYLKPLEWPGETRAIREFLDTNSLRLERNELANPYLVKPPHLTA